MPQKVRQEILAFVEQYPGVHAREVERQLGLPNRLGAYHLDALAAEGVLERIDASGYARFFPRAATLRLTPRDVLFICTLRRAPALQIVLLLLSASEITPGAMAEELGLARPSVSYHLKELAAEEVVVARAEGRERRYALRDPAYARQMLASYHPLPGDLDAFSRLWDDLVGR